MSTHSEHNEKEAFYFVTFTYYRWLPLIEKTNLYSYLSNWSVQLDKRGVKVCGYVLMPNHIHLLVFVEKDSKGLNAVLGEAKRFMAYEIVKRLKQNNKQELLKVLSEGVQIQEKKKGKKHQVFRLSFDAKLVEGEEAINKVLDYMHHNPVMGKWNLVDDFVDFSYSSAGYYESGRETILRLYDYRDVFSESSLSDSEE